MKYVTLSEIRGCYFESVGEITCENQAMVMNIFKAM